MIFWKTKTQEEDNIDENFLKNKKKIVEINVQKSIKYLNSEWFWYTMSDFDPLPYVIGF